MPERHTKHGEKLNVIVSAALICRAEEKPTGMVVNLTDISRLKRMESALRDSEEKYRTLFEFSEDALFLGKITQNTVEMVGCNSRACDMFKCSRDRLLGSKPADISPERQPDGSDSVKAAQRYSRAAHDGLSQHFYWKHKRFDGDTFDTEMTLNRLEIGNDIYLQGIVRDISKK